MHTSTSPARITTAEAATRLGVTTKTIHRWLAQGRLTRYELGPRLVRLSSTEVDALAGESVSAEDELARSIAALIANHDGFSDETMAFLAQMLAPDRRRARAEAQSVQVAS
jgi:excisionase family DNA binding protein